MILITDVQEAPGVQILNTFVGLQQPENIRILLPPGADSSFYEIQNIDFVTGNLCDHPSLDKAMKNVETLVITHSNLLSDLRCGYTNLMYTALGAGVKHVIYLSSILVGNSSCILAEEDMETENVIRKSGILYTILRPNILMEQMPMFIGDPVATGEILFPGGNGRISFTSAEAVAEIVLYFAQNRPKVSATYKISNDISHSFTDVADILSSIVEMPIHYSPVETSFFKESLLNERMPESLTDRIVSVAESIGNNEFDVPDFTLFRLLERRDKEREEECKKTFSNWFSGKTRYVPHTERNKNLSDYLKEVYL